ncbi:two-component response regulator-like APRR9 [Impatiens glandulifera]|uniref:two-component response regulator-like APRR9 n=1 Tax=Impatiens glandulifera TaxID=253017 RepID=UPI001FB11A64|nr:two-component response regulator-like APRR9 [Impatiens glandulifera]
MGELVLTHQQQQQRLSLHHQHNKTTPPGIMTTTADEELQVIEVLDQDTANNKGDASSSVLRWERFLPRMVLRVLLVESDDSTRQIITALLRKCSYRVAAVSDGLKAWELLKGKPCNIDLILTEVDLPSISGFALLTLINEHDICKRIPVIMMSSQDSVSMVYKCMLRGSANFLVKPVRKNELRNLWQHVWRRQTLIGSGLGPIDESVAQQKVEATADNNDASNHSSGYIASIQRNRERIEKGSDAQSSCTKPDMEADVLCLENLHEPLKSRLPETNVMNPGESSMTKNKSMEVAANKDAKLVGGEKDEVHESQIGDPNITKEAIDLIGAFDHCSNISYRNFISNNYTDKVEDSSMLDLSLRRSDAGSPVNQATGENNRLKQSDVSAFSRYVSSKTLQPLQSVVTKSQSPEDHGTGYEKQTSANNQDFNKNNTTELARGLSGEVEISFQRPQQSKLSVPVPVRAIYYAQSGSTSLLQGPGSVCNQEPLFSMHPFHQSNNDGRNSQEISNLMDQQANNSGNQTEMKRMNKLDSSDDRRHLSSATDRSASGSFCNGAMSSINYISPGDSKNVDNVNQGHNRLTAESENEESFLIQNRNLHHRYFQRAAALSKFRLKRKERCYEKKVRYESRKKLAEQRPRVKGQFVRQVANDLVLVETDSEFGNLLDG